METVDMDLDLDVGSARDEESCRILNAPGTRSAFAKSHREVVRLKITLVFPSGLGGDD
jgi:hypothetical protein